jgi:hypothetical protein
MASPFFKMVNPVYGSILEERIITLQDKVFGLRLGYTLLETPKVEVSKTKLGEIELLRNEVYVVLIYKEAILVVSGLNTLSGPFVLLLTSKR